MPFCTQRLFPVGLLSICLLALLAFDACAEDQAKKEDSAAAAASPEEQWKAISAKRDEIAKQLAVLGQEFNKTEDNARKQEIYNQYMTLINEFQTKLQPQMTELAETIFAKDPKNVEAGEIVLQQAYASNHYKEAAEIADKLLPIAEDSPAVANFGGAAHFAVHDFAKAQEILKKAEKDGTLDPRLGGRYLDEAGKYIELWKKEQAIREAEEKATGDAQLPLVVFKTNKGDVELELFENEAPNTVANFISLVEAKKYDGTKFHRVINNFMVQGGDPKSLDDDPANDGTGGPGYTIACECYQENARMHFRGSLSMAHAGKDTGGSQFFITHLPTSHLNPNPQAQSGHTVFGRVVKGMDVVDSIEPGDQIISATVTRKRNHEYKPVTEPEK